MFIFNFNAMCKAIILLLLPIVATLDGLQAQDQRRLDSLENAVRVARNDVEKYDALHGLAVEYIDHDNDKALQITKEAEAVAIGSGDTLCYIKSQRLKGQISYRLGMTQEAIACLKPLLNMPGLARHPNEHLSILNALSICHSIVGQFDWGLSYQFQTMQLAKKLTDSEYVAVSLMNIGLTYYKLRLFKKALPFMLRSHQMQDSLKITKFTSLINMSLCYRALHNLKESERFLERGLKVCGTECPPAARLHINYVSGCLFFDRQEYENAERAFLTSLKSSEELEDYRLVLDNICMLAEMHIRRNELATARVYLERGENVIAAGAPYNIERIGICKLLAGLYLQVKDYKKASLYQVEYNKFRDSVYNEALTANLMKIESEFLERENQTRIEKQLAVISDNEQTIERQSWLNIVVGLVSIMTIISTIFFYRSYRIKKNINILLEARVRERTSAIEFEVGGLVKELKEKALQMKRLGQAVGESVKSLKGMSNIASEDMYGSAMKVYVTKVDETIDRLERINGHLMVETK